MNDDGLRGWRLAGLIASVVIVLTIPVYAVRESLSRSTARPTAGRAAEFVGGDRCAKCHEQAYDAWRGSDHERAMAVAEDSTVLGDFDDAVFEYGDVKARFYRRDGKYYVYTQGPNGEPGEFRVAYTFGFDPLQQYLIPFPGGRLQALTIAWDTERGEWFYLYPGQDIPPDDWLHWTRGAQNWNGMCADCHSTNLIKGYDYASKTFNTTWSEINVSCEACHGPGSRHVEWAEMPPMARPDVENYELVVRTDDISSKQLVDLCAPCHSRRSELGEFDYTQGDLLDNIVPETLREGLYFADGQILEEVYVYGSFVQSKMFRNNVRCSDCHDVHSLKLLKDGNDLCLQCHRADTYDSYDHHFHKKIYKGKPSDGALCVKCHMPERPYMVVDWRADHSIRIPRPDLTLDIGVPNACGQGGCHDDKSVAWSAEHYREWYGKAKRPHYGTIIAAGREARPEAEPDLIRLAGDELYPPIVRATALSLLTSYSGPAADSAFNRALFDDEALVRYTAVANMYNPDAGDRVDRLAPMLFDPVRAVRIQAASMLAGTPDQMLKPYQREALRKALAEYIAANEYSLDFAQGGFNLGNLYAKLGESARAETYYRAALDIDDLFYPAKVNLAILLNSVGRNDEAEKLLREVLEAYPDRHDVAYSLGLLLAEMGRPEEAAGYLEQAAKGMGNNARAFYNLGLIQQQLGQTAAAEASLLKATRLEPANLDFLYALADHYIKRGQLEKALPIADRMIATHPESSLGADVKRYVENALKR